MRTSRHEKEKTLERIVEGAARLIRERGIEATCVADVMSSAGLTHGGFYRHFEGKGAMVLAALEAAFAERHDALERRFLQHEPADALAAYRRDYLDHGHLGAVGMGCPAPTLAGDVARSPEPLKAAYGANIRRVIATLAQGMQGSADERQACAAREMAMLAGAIMLARASDPETAAMVLAACRETPDEPAATKPQARSSRRRGQSNTGLA